MDARYVLVVLLLIGRIDTQEIMVACDLVHQNVVNESAVFVQQAGIMSLTGLQLADGVCGDIAGESVGLRTLDFDFAHVAYVEQARSRSDRSVLFQDAGILERHFPAAEIDHFCAHPAMRGVESSGLESGGGHHELAKLWTAESSSGNTSIT